MLNKVQLKARKFLKGILPNKIIWLYNKVLCKVLDYRYYDHILPLYPNCEAAFQFQRYFGFVESSLFTWCAAVSFDGFIDAIENTKKIFSNGIIPKFDWGNMLQCKETGLAFHGYLTKEELLDQAGNADEEKIKIEYAKVISRVKHLARKLEMTWASNDTQLYILSCNEYFHKFTCDEINRIYEVLKSKSKNAGLLVIVKEKELYEEALDRYYLSKDIIIRKIEKWTPPNDVTALQLSDEEGWHNIFKRFKTKNLNQEGKKYKFERLAKFA